MNRETARKLMNNLAASGTPFLFIVDFDEINIQIVPLCECRGESIFFDIEGFRNYISADLPVLPEVQFETIPVEADVYRRGFEVVQFGLRRGDSFLVNLTFPTEIQTNLSLQDIFFHSRARYKLLYKNEFTCFSPEIFVRIEKNGRISSHPMKGTIDAQISNATQQILEDPKEKAEHNTIVDLIRNDLSKVANAVKVDRYRYIDVLKTNGKSLLQVSSEISGQLGENWMETLGDTLFELLPAGSISGAPKTATLQIIEKAEICKRGYYSGVFGLFDGNSLNSAVMIRFVEHDSTGKMWFKSGGGITVYAEVEAEYKELCDKVYLPIYKD